MTSPNAEKDEMPLSIGFKTDPGNVRKKNEDSYAVLNRNDLVGKLDGLLVLADGMGGMGGGDVASSIVAETLPQAVLETLTARNGHTGPPDAERMLHDTIVRANEIVRMRRQMDASPDMRVMGTTCVAAIVHEGRLTLANVGDSRAYLLRDGALQMLTEDHSEVWEEVKAGRMTREEAENHRFRNRITRAIGLQRDVAPDVQTVPLREGDTLLLCSDGLTTEVREPQIARILATSAEVQTACDRLVKAALQNGGRDNITTLVLRYGAFTPVGDDVMLAPEEAPTDPDPEWRRHLNPEVEAWEEEEKHAPKPSRGGRRPVRTNGIMVLLIGLLLIAIAEGVVLYQTLRNHTPAPSPVPPSQDLSVQANNPVNYGAPTLVSTKRLREDVLLMTGENDIVVASQGGNLLRINRTGEVALLGSTLPAVGPLSSVLPASSSLSAPVEAAVAMGPADTLYYFNPASRCIETYNRVGTRTHQDIGAGSLTRPTRIFVTPKQVIYLIDNHVLKRIDPVEGKHVSPTAP